jgi:hypothetical protein
MLFSFGCVLSVSYKDAVGILGSVEITSTFYRGKKSHVRKRRRTEEEKK